MAEYVVKRSLDLSTPNNNRYIVISTVTGEIVDDAQGYGYKSAEKAVAAFKWKLGHKDKLEVNQKQKAIKKWIKDNPEFDDALTELEFDYVKRIGKGVTANIVGNLLNELDIHTDFEPKEILSVWRKKR